MSDNSFLDHVSKVGKEQKEKPKAFKMFIKHKEHIFTFNDDTIAQLTSMEFQELQKNLTM